LPHRITIKVEWWLGIDSEGKIKMSCYVMLEFTAKPGTDPAALEAFVPHWQKAGQGMAAKALS
jgi:hypothetical protein